MTIQLVQNTVYRGRLCLKLSAIEKAFVTESDVRTALESAGWKDVHVWFDTKKLPADWPAEKIPNGCSGETPAWAQLRWAAPTGEYPTDGEKWRLLDGWVYKEAPTGQQPFCASEGYTCDPNAPPYATTCCGGLVCTHQPSTGDSRCMQATVPDGAKPSTWYWWLLGIVGVGAIGTLAWWMTTRPKHNPVARRAMEVQSLLFSRDRFDRRSARAWARRHGYKYGKVDVTANYIRLRQRDPAEFGFMRTIAFGDSGIKAVVGR